MRIFRTGLVFGLIATASVTSASFAYATTTIVAHETSKQNSNNEYSLEVLIEKEGRLRSEKKYDEAIAVWRRILAILEKSLGANHPDVATSLSNLAFLLNTQGRYAAAEPLYRRSLVIRETALGPDHPDVASSLNNLAMLLSDQGQYAAAEPLYRRSLAIREKALGPDHPDVALMLNNLAMLLSNKGQYTAAEPLYRRSLAINEKVHGPDYPDVAPVLNNLASLLSKQGQYATAEALFRRSLAIQEKALGPGHPNVAILINNLALLLSDQGQYAAAEALYRRSLAIHEKAFGPDHPVTAAILNNLAEVFYYRGQYSSAEPLVRRSLAIRQSVLGANHPDVATTLGKLALLLGEQGKHSSALIFLDKSEKVKTNWYLKELPLLPDLDRTAQLRQLGDEDEWKYTFGMIEFYPPAVQLALETRLNRQGLLRDIERSQTLLLNSPGVDRIKVKQLQSLVQQLTSVTLPIDRRAKVGRQRDKLQADLYRQIPELQLQPVTTSEVAKALPADGALVEFQRYQPFDGSKQKDQRWGAAQYIALVLKPNGSINAVPLGPAAAIDAQVHKGLRASADGLSDTESILAQLSIQLLKPLLPQLTGSRQWFLSPDGELNRVPFAALPSPQQSDAPLAEAVQLRQLTTGRDLLQLQQPAAKGQAPVVFANPDFGRTAKIAQKTTKSTDDPIAQQRSSDLGQKTWSPLPATALEGQRVATMLAARLLTGSDASAMHLEHEEGPRILHVATHGFFVADAVSTPQDPLRLIQDQAPQLNALRQEDPQLRSGLVLAGANQPDANPNDDGYLTAAEAVTLNLKGTELVVLSACSTGQGDIRTGEGVYGLQRSLAVAGARSTLLSLWKVDDAATLEFMTRFYKRLKAGIGRADALAATQKEFRAGIPGKPEWKEPYYWAAWQLVGDWRPIPGL